jgi:hypothetical protein
MSQDWNSTNLTWQDTDLPWKSTALPWNSTSLPWKVNPVPAPGGGDPTMDFSVDTNSMYVALLADG